MKNDAPEPPLEEQTTRVLALMEQTITGPPLAKPDDSEATAVGELLKANTSLLVWLVFLAFGGGILALYYARIGYMPDIEWNSSIVYLAVATFIGGGVGLLFLLSLLLPGLIWAESLLCDSRLAESFSFDSGELCLRTILRFLGVPFGLVLLVSHVVLIADHIAGSPKTGAIIYFAIAVVLLIRTFLVMQVIFQRLLANGSVYDSPPASASPPVGSDKEPTTNGILKRSFLAIRHLLKISRSQLDEELWTSDTFKYSILVIRCFLKVPRSEDSPVPDDNRTDPEDNRRVFKYSAWFTLSVSLSQISMLVVYRLSGGPGGLNFFVLTVICTTGVLISNHVVAVRYRTNQRQAVAASLVSAIVLLFVADQFSPLSEGIMAFYGFGKGYKVTVLVDEEGAAIIKNLGLPNQDSRERVNDVEILSRLGNEYYLRVGGSDSTAGRNFTLPKSTVRSFISTQERSDKAIGQEHTVNLLVNEDGLTIIDKLGLPQEYRTPNREGLRDVEILSKTDNEYYLRIGHSDVNPGRTFVLPKATVISFISTEVR